MRRQSQVTAPGMLTVAQAGGIEQKSTAISPGRCRCRTVNRSTVETSVLLEHAKCVWRDGVIGVYRAAALLQPIRRALP